MISENGGNLGIMSLEAALKLAMEKGLDLVEVVPLANPPVARIISFDKFRYQKEKEERKQRKSQKISELKKIRITPRAAKNDLEVKMKKVEEFLSEGHKVEIMIFLRGREKANKDWGRSKLEEFLKAITIEHKIIAPIKFAGRGFVAQVQTSK